jgi:hypothetical protein
LPKLSNKDIVCWKNIPAVEYWWKSRVNEIEERSGKLGMTAM